MEYEGKGGSLNEIERRIIKKLCNDGWTNQDIQALINRERKATINFGRISTVKKDQKQSASGNSELEKYKQFKAAFDPRTGLNTFLDERLIKSREAMSLAVQVFNNPGSRFRAESFTMLAVVAWTYLVIEYSARNELPTERKNGDAVSLSDFLKHDKCPFAKGISNNLKALTTLRNKSEHRLLGPFEDRWAGIFQATCINFEREIVKNFGKRLSLAHDHSFALQFSSLSIGQSKMMSEAELPEVVKAINKELYEHLADQELDDQEFQFSVVYTTVESSKSKAAFQFFAPDSAEGKEISNVLIKHKPSALTHPYRPSDVVKLIRKHSGKPFNMADHSKSWRLHKVRPAGDAGKPADTKLDYCYYHPTYKSYCYNDAWVSKLTKEIEK